MQCFRLKEFYFSNEQWLFTLPIPEMFPWMIRIPGQFWRPLLPYSQGDRDMIVHPLLRRNYVNNESNLLIKLGTSEKDVYACAFRWGTSLQAGRPRVWFPRKSLRFFIFLILPARSGPGVDSASNRDEYQGFSLAGKGGRCLELTTRSQHT